jgi:cytochrome c biogenesis protein CcdA
MLGILHKMFLLGLSIVTIAICIIISGLGMYLDNEYMMLIPIYFLITIILLGLLFFGFGLMFGFVGGVGNCWGFPAHE